MKQLYPSKGKERLKSMIETRPGLRFKTKTPLPIINKKTNEILVDDNVFENIAKSMRKRIRLLVFR